jgi:hypothetical protein
MPTPNLCHQILRCLCRQSESDKDIVASSILQLVTNNTMSGSDITEFAQSLFLHLCGEESDWKLILDMYDSFLINLVPKVHSLLCE